VPLRMGGLRTDGCIGGRPSLCWCCSLRLRRSYVSGISGSRDRSGLTAAGGRWRDTVAVVLMESSIVDAVGTGLSTIASVDVAHPILRIITTETTHGRRIAEPSPT
jgi:hypothetical protein